MREPAAENLHVLTQYVAHSLNRPGAAGHPIFLTASTIILRARHPEAILVGDPHRVADLRRDWQASAQGGLKAASYMETQRSNLKKTCKDV